MTIKSLLFTTLLLNSNLFAKTKIDQRPSFTIGEHRLKKYIEIMPIDLTPNKSRTVIPLSLYDKLPKEISLEDVIAEQYYEANDYLKQIINFSNISTTCDIYSQNNLLIIETENNTFLDKSKDTKPLFLSHQVKSQYIIFSWIQKLPLQLSPLEKNIKEYYKVENNQAVSFLYSYDKPGTDPWAIKINDTIYATIWAKSKTNSKQSNLIDPFLILESNEENANLEVLINENDKILAKRINGVVTFRSQ